MRRLVHLGQRARLSAGNPDLTGYTLRQHLEAALERLSALEDDAPRVVCSTGAAWCPTAEEFEAARERGCSLIVTPDSVLAIGHDGQGRQAFVAVNLNLAELRVETEDRCESEPCRTPEADQFAHAIGVAIQAAADAATTGNLGDHEIGANVGDFKVIAHRPGRGAGIGLRGVEVLFPSTTLIAFRAELAALAYRGLAVTLDHQASLEQALVREASR